MKSGEMLREMERLVVAAQWDALALSREADRRQRVLAALRTLIEARADLAKAGYALVPLEPTEAMLRAAADTGSHENGLTRVSPDSYAEPWRALVRPETVRDAAQELKRPEFIDWMTGILDMVERRARLAERIGISQAIARGLDAKPVSHLKPEVPGGSDAV